MIQRRHLKYNFALPTLKLSSLSVPRSEGPPHFTVAVAVGQSYHKARGRQEYRSEWLKYRVAQGELSLKQGQC